MDNNIPNIKELKGKITNYEINDDLFYTIISLLTIFPWFRKFLEKKWYNDEYELTTIIFWQLIDYIEEKIELNEIYEIKRILSFLDLLSISKNKEIINLVSVWFLENLDNYKEVLNFIIEIMPDNLKKIFLKWYWYYLD